MKISQCFVALSGFALPFSAGAASYQAKVTPSLTKLEAHAMTLAEAKPVLAAHDSEGRFRYTLIKKVGNAHVKGRIFSIFDLNFINPVSQHGMQLVAILEGRRFLGAYQTSGSVISIRGSRIHFACDRYDRLHYYEFCERKYFQDIDLSKSNLPMHRLIRGDFVEIWDSI